MVDREPEIFRRKIIEEKLFEPRWASGTARENQPPYEARLQVNRWKGEEKITRTLSEKDENGKPVRHIIIAAGFTVSNGRRLYSVRREALYPPVEDRLTDLS